MNSLPIRSSDAIVDLGCGKGGVLISLSKYPFAAVDGVEISEQLISVAIKNLAIAKCAKTKFYCGDAANFKLYDKYNFIYTYNSFPPVVMCDVISNIMKSIDGNPRVMTIIYRNPTCHDLVVNGGHFKVVSEFEFSATPTSKPFFIYQNQI
jgi:SAM-dependent methyltransferase